METLENKEFLEQRTVLCTDCGILHSPMTAPLRIEKHRKPEEIWCVSPDLQPLRPVQPLVGRTHSRELPRRPDRLRQNLWRSLAFQAITRVLSEPVTDTARA